MQRSGTSAGTAPAAAAVTTSPVRSVSVAYPPAENITPHDSSAM